MNNVTLIIIAILVAFAINAVPDKVLSPSAKYIVTWLTILIFVFIYVFGQCAAGSAVAKLHKLGEQLDTEQQSQAVETENNLITKSKQEKSRKRNYINLPHLVKRRL